VLPGSTEASVNLWSVYASENVLGIPRAKAHPSLDPAERAKTIQAYIAGGKNFAKDWNVWTSLETYLELQEGFGWAPFQQVFTQYYADAPAMDPADDQGKIDRWVLRFSIAVNKDLGPFFKGWGFPISPAVLSQTSALPAWQNNPMP
jgi:Peptidase M60, enhancin and enhancin-like